MCIIPDIIAWKAFCDSFDRLSVRAERKAAPKVDLYAERKRLELLHQKRDLLSGLIQVHTNELRTLGAPSITPRDFSCIKSEYGDSQASWATFASRDSRGGLRKTSISERPYFVPALNLPNQRNISSRSRRESRESSRAVNR